MGKPTLTLPSVERLLEVFFYDEIDGELYLRCDRGPRKAGMIAGGVNAAGYISVALDGKRYLAHRLIWKMKTGNDPIIDVDHEDTDGTNNRFANLREANESQNLQNMSMSRRNSSGVKGVYFDNALGKWRASVMANRVVHRVGNFDNIEDAKAAVNIARERLHGDFARAA